MILIFSILFMLLMANRIIKVIKNTEIALDEIIKMLIFPLILTYALLGILKAQICF